MRFKDWKIIYKILSVFLLTLVSAILFNLFVILPAAESTIISERMSATKQVVEVGHSILNYYENKYKKNEISLEEAKNLAIQSIHDLRYSGSEYFFIFDDRLIMVMHPFSPELDGTDISTIEDPNGKKIFVEMNDLVKSSEQGFVEYMWPRENSKKPVPKISYVIHSKTFGWIIGSGVYVDDIQNQINKLKLRIVIFIALGSIPLLLLAVFIVNLITRPIKNAVKFSNVLASGDLSAQIEVDSRDEIGELQSSMSIMGQNLLNIVKELQESEDKVGSVSENMTETSGNLLKGTEDMSLQASSIASATTQMDQNLQVVSSSMEELAISITEVARRSADAASKSEEADVSTQNASAIVRELNENAIKIGAVIDSIVSIANRTNLLALNASIEAAGAGEVGKGFAVVASEVKELATQAAHSSEEVKQLILTVQKSAENTESSISNITKIMATIRDISANIAAAVEEQSVTAKETTANISQISVASNEITRNIEEISGVARSGAKDAAKVSNLAEELNVLIENLEKIVSRFKIE